MDNLLQSAKHYDFYCKIPDSRDSLALGSESEGVCVREGRRREERGEEKRREETGGEGQEKGKGLKFQCT